MEEALEIVNANTRSPSLTARDFDSLTSATTGITQPMPSHLLTYFMESFSSRLWEAREDQADSGDVSPSNEAIDLAQRITTKWIEEAVCVIPVRVASWKLGVTFTHRGDVELVLRDPLRDSNKVLWVSSDAKRTKLLGIDSDMRVTRQLTEQLW